MSDRPPEPQAPPTVAPPGPPPRGTVREDPLAGYHMVTDTVGGPSLRVKDNLIQAAVVLGGAAAGAGAGYLLSGRMGVPPGAGAAIGGVVAAVAATLVSGVVLMVLGWVRAARRR